MLPDHGETPLALRNCIQKVATGPNYSKNLSYAEAYEAMQLILQNADPVQAGVLLIALRMKRETDEENKGVLQAIIDKTKRMSVDLPELMDIADPYDGFTRGLPVAGFLPAVLAALGIPAVCHGLQAVGPKFGVTHRMVLKAAGVNVDVSPSQAAAQLTQPQTGWTYIDQSQYCLALHNLVDLRRRMVKRTCITTVEVLTGPMRASGVNHLMTGYVHNAYPPVYAELARFSGYDSALIMRGVEGGIIPSLQQPANVFYYQAKGPEQMWQLNPKEMGIEHSNRAIPLPPDVAKSKTKGDAIATTFDTHALAVLAAEKGMQALAGEQGPAFDSLVIAAASCLKHLGRAESMPEAADQVRQVLTSGAALSRFQTLT